MVVIRVASHCGTRPPCNGRSATPERFTLFFYHEEHDVGDVQRCIVLFVYLRELRGKAVRLINIRLTTALVVNVTNHA